MRYLVIGIVVALIVIGGYVKVQSILNGNKWATENLLLFTINNDLKAGTCNGYDTNGDGAISCTAKDKDGKFIQLECGADLLTEGTGSCKTQRGFSTY